MPSILFLCIHNACRSRIAEAVCKNMAPDWMVASAGCNPSEDVDTKAALILKKNGLSMVSGKPKGFPEVSAQKWDYIVAMDNGDRCPQGLRTDQFIEWKIEDPFDGPMEIYQTLYEELTRRIEALLKKNT